MKQGTSPSSVRDLRRIFAYGWLRAGLLLLLLLLLLVIRGFHLSRFSGALGLKSTDEGQNKKQNLYAFEPEVAFGLLE